MLSPAQPDRIHVAFDDHRLVANAGLLLPVTLAHHLGLGELVDCHVDLGDAPGRANAGDKMLTLVASALAGGDCIDDAAALRAGGTARGLSGVELVTSDAHHRRTYRCIRRQPNANKADDGDRNRPFPPGRLLLTVSANGKSDRPDDHRTRSNPHGNKVLPQVHVHQFPAAPAAGRSVPAAIAAAINTNRSWCQVHDSVP